MPGATPRGAHQRAPLMPTVPATAAVALLTGVLALAGCSAGAQGTPPPAETPRPTNNGSIFDLPEMASTPGTIRVKVGSAAEIRLAATVVVDQTQGTMITGTGGASPAASGAGPAASAAGPAASAAGPSGSGGAATVVEVSWSALTSTGRVSVSGPDSAIASLDADCFQTLDQASAADFSGTIQCAAHPTARSSAVVPLTVTFEFGGDGAD